jgi:hypothetical protein
MTFTTRSAALALAVALCAAAASAQEHPDLTGVWTTYRAPGAPPFGGGTTPRVGELALTPEAQARSDAYRAAIEGTDEAPGAYCVGEGMPGSMLGSGPYPMEIIQRPEQITVVYELHNEMRRIFVGDRAAEINPEDVFPERNGFSVGRWEGDALIVETDHLVEQVDTRYPHSAQARIREEYRLSTEQDEDGNDKRVLTAAVTMTDPLWLTAPYTVEKKWQAAPGARLMTYECTEPLWLDALAGLLGEEEPE